MGLGVTHGPLQLDYAPFCKTPGLGRQADPHPGCGVGYAGLKVAAVPTDILTGGGIQAGRVVQGDPGPTRMAGKARGQLGRNANLAA